MTLSISHIASSLHESFPAHAGSAWVIGDNESCLIIGSSGAFDEVEEAVEGRTVLAILLTSASEESAKFAPELAERFEAAMLLHPDAAEDWEALHGELEWDADIEDGEEFEFGTSTIRTVRDLESHAGRVAFLVTSADATRQTAHLFLDAQTNAHSILEAIDNADQVSVHQASAPEAD